MNSMVSLAILAWFWLWCAVFAAIVSSSKGHEGGAWFAAGFFFGPLGFLASLGLPDRKGGRGDE